MTNDASSPAGNRTSYLESVDNALRLVLLLAQRESVGVSEVARELGLAPSTAHRLLATLRYRGFAVQSQDRTYRPGPAFATIAAPRAAPLDLVGLVTPYLDRLRVELDETCHLVVRQGREVRFLTSVEALRQLRVTERTGAVLPAHRTSGGKALLAELPAGELQREYPETGVPELGMDVQAVQMLLRELRTVRRRRYALNRGESERGIAAVGMAVHRDGQAVAAVSVSMPTVRFSSSRLEELLPVLRRTVAAVDEQLAT